MGRFFKELKYSLGLKRHLFFIILIGIAACGAAWLFQDTLRKELKKSFPGTYDLQNAALEESKYLLRGEVKQKSPQVTDGDLKAEIKFNAELQGASWVKNYEEICTEYMQIASYLGPDSAVKGYGTDEYYDNKDVDSNGVKYTTVQTIWMDASLAEKFKLGSEAKQIYNMPNNYLERIYVVLGSEYKGDYSIGTILKAQNSVGSIQMQVVGFLPSNAKATIGDKEIELDSYILCPFISLQDVYEIKEEVPAAYTDGIYIPVSAVNGEFLSGAYRNNPPNKKNDPKTGVQYVEVRSLWIERAAVTEEAPEWLKALAGSTEKDKTLVMVGANYGAAGTIANSEVSMYSAQGVSTLKVHGVLDPGSTWNIYGMEINLDDYIVFLQPEEKKEETNSAETNPDGTLDPGTTLIDEPVGPKEREFKVKERSILFHYQTMMNRGYITTMLTRNEAQISLAEVLDSAWRDFRRDNPKKDPLTTYRIDGSSKDNSILYRENSMKLTEKVLKFTKYGFPICALLFAVYLFWKFRSGKEFYTTLYLTGTNRTEMMVMYLIEGLLMAAAASAFAFGFSFVICKLLKLKMSAAKPVIRRIFKLIGYPTIAIMIWILIRDFGRMFRRTQEV
ncbi:MAG: hypothetical protein J5643_01555 [Lachnospiraceae bacterium]|nr:hypothetical protein [Lachnospiraceae bacterium]